MDVGQEHSLCKHGHLSLGLQHPRTLKSVAVQALTPGLEGWAGC